MSRTLLVCFVVLAGCSIAESDLGSFGNDSDACDPRGTPQRGGNLTIHFRNTTAHINQDMRLAIEVGDHNVEALAVISTFDDPNLDLILPEMMTNDSATLAFWADTNANGVFDSLNPPDASTVTMDAGADGGPPMTISPDHQWFRPICPNGDMTFTHTTPFQDISHATSNGSVFQFIVPPTFRTSTTAPEHHLLENFAMAVWAVQVDETGRQTRVYYRWQPFVGIPAGSTPPTQRPGPAHDLFQIGGNVLGEHRGAIDQGSVYEVHFVIDANHNGRMDGHDTDDFNCTWTGQQAPMGDPWMFDPTTVGGGLTANCDDNGFDPTVQ